MHAWQSLTESHFVYLQIHFLSVILVHTDRYGWTADFKHIQDTTLIRLKFNCQECD